MRRTHTAVAALLMLAAGPHATEAANLFYETFDAATTGPISEPSLTADHTWTVIRNAGSTEAVVSLVGKDRALAQVAGGGTGRTILFTDIGTTISSAGPIRLSFDFEFTALTGHGDSFMRLFVLDGPATETSRASGYCIGIASQAGFLGIFNRRVLNNDLVSEWWANATTGDLISTGQTRAPSPVRYKCVVIMRKLSSGWTQFVAEARQYGGPYLAGPNSTTAHSQVLPADMSFNTIEIVFEPHATQLIDNLTIGDDPPPEIAVGDGAVNVPDDVGFVDFGAGGAPLSKVLTATNLGPGVLGVGGLSVPVGYSVSEPLSFYISPGTSDTFTIDLLTSAPGTYSGTVSFGNTDADENPYNFTVTGILEPPEIAVLDGATNIPDNIGSVDFGTPVFGGAPVSKTFTVANAGTGTLFTANLTVPTGYSVTEGLNPTVAGGTSETFTVELSTAAPGPFAGTIQFNNNDADEDPFDFGVTGTVLAAEIVVRDGPTTIPDNTGSVDFGSALFGTVSPTKTFTVSNVGGVPLDTSNLSLPPGYSVTEGLTDSIAPGTSDTFTVALSTVAPGTFAGTISFDTNDPDENPFDFGVTGIITQPEVAVSDGPTSVPDGTGSVDFGAALIGTAPLSKTLAVLNTGNGDLISSGLAVPSGYRIVEGLAATVAPGTSDTFTVDLPTSVPGTFAGRIVFDNNDLDEDPFDFHVTGRIKAPEVEVSDGASTVPDNVGAIDFGTALVGTARPSKTLTVTNTGDGELLTSGLVVPAGYVLIDGLAASIAPGTSDTFTIDLLTSVPGTFAGTVSFETNDLDENPFNFDVAGTITQPEVAVYDEATSIPDDTGSIDFGTALIDTAPLRKVFTVMNTGDGALLTSGLLAPTGYAVTDGLTASIAPGTSDTFTVDLPTSVPGTFSGTIRFDTNDRDENPYDFNVTGTITAPEIAVHDGATTVPNEIGSVDFGAALVGTAALSRIFIVTNRGDGALLTSGLTVPAGYVVAEALAGSIAPGTSDTFTVDLPTSVPGTFAGTLAFETNDLDENPFDFHVTGVITQPEVAVFDGATAIPNDVGSVDFGETYVGAAAKSRTLAVMNTGNGALLTSGLIVPIGYVVTEGLAASIAPATSDTFTVDLATGIPGMFAGTIRFETNDLDENPFRFRVTGSVIERSTSTRKSWLHYK